MTPLAASEGAMRPKKHETKDLFALSDEEVCERWVYESAHGNALNAYRNHEGVRPWDID